MLQQGSPACRWVVLTAQGQRLRGDSCKWLLCGDSGGLDHLAAGWLLSQNIQVSESLIRIFS